MEATAELNIDAAADSIAADILGKNAPADDLDTTIDNAADAAEQETAVAEAAKAPPPTDKGNGKDADATVTMPKSWAKDQQEVWDEMTPRARQQYLHREKQMLDGLEGYKGDAEYGRGLRPVLSKHDALLQQQGLQHAQAVEYLLNAHAQFSTGTQEQKLAYLERVANHYGLTTKPQAAADGTPATQLPPEMKAVIERQERIESALRQEQTQRYETVKQETTKTVEAFASDPKNAYFEEVAEDIAKLIKAGETLESAYEKAVWANPVTRQKEIARIQQADAAAAAEKVKEAAKAAKKATSTNVKGRDTTRSPTGSRATLDSMDEVLSETLAEIKSRH